jgi:thiol:disulfide interchange protein DsbD
VEAATAAGKPVMIDFTADWCVYCEKLEDDSFTDPKIIEAASEFERLQVDGTKKSALVKNVEDKYGVSGYPTVIFIDGSGKEARHQRVTCYVNRAEMLKRILAVGGS